MKQRKSFYILAVFALISLMFNIFLSLRLFSTVKTNPLLKDSVQVSRVIDGDTFDTPSGERVRFYEINAPEYPKDCMGADAKNRLEELILDKTVQIIRVRKDNFGRTLAFVYSNDLLINETLTEEGLAYFTKDKNLNELSLTIEQAENKAKSAARGVWSSLCQTQKPGCLIKANFRSADHTRIYHTPDCYNYDKITIKPGTTDRWFCTEEEAKQAGFKKSLDCPKR